MKNAYYGKGSGPIWRLRDGCHHDIAQCLSPITEHIDCNHDNDVGVFCLCEFIVHFSYTIFNLYFGVFLLINSTYK